MSGPLFVVSKFERHQIVFQVAEAVSLSDFMALRMRVLHTCVLKTCQLKSNNLLIFNRRRVFGPPDRGNLCAVLSKETNVSLCRSSAGFSAGIGKDMIDSFQVC